MNLTSSTTQIIGSIKKPVSVVGKDRLLLQQKSERSTESTIREGSSHTRQLPRRNNFFSSGQRERRGGSELWWLQLEQLTITTARHQHQQISQRLCAREFRHWYVMEIQKQLRAGAEVVVLNNINMGAPLMEKIGPSGWQSSMANSAMGLEMLESPHFLFFLLLLLLVANSSSSFPPPSAWFLHSFFVSFSPLCITQQVYCVYEKYAHQMTVLLPEIIVFLVRVARELRLVSYGLNCTSQTLFYTSFFCELTRTTRTTKVV